MKVLAGRSVASFEFDVPILAQEFCAEDGTRLVMFHREVTSFLPRGVCVDLVESYNVCRVKSDFGSDDFYAELLFISGQERAKT